MGDVGIDLLKPQYDKSMIVPADTAYWEVLYTDGTTLCEAAGAKYPQIDRARLDSFRIIHNGMIVFELHPQGDKTGHNLIYRRRTMMVGEGGGRAVVFIVGLGPDGTFFVVDLEHDQYYEDPNIVTSLTPMPGEPDDILPNLTGEH